MLQPFGQDAQGQSLSTRHRFFARGAVGQHPGQFRDFGDPPPIGLLLDFDLEHGAMIARPSREVENLEILFFSTRMKGGQGVNVPVLADFHLPQAI